MISTKERFKFLQFTGLCSFALVGLIALGAVAEEMGGGDSGRDGDGAGDELDETIGGHPLTYGGPDGPNYGPGAGAHGAAPVLHLEGPIHHVFSAVAAVSGSGQVVATTTAPGMLRVEFLGQLDIALNEAVLATAPLELGFDARYQSDLRVAFSWTGGRTPVSTVAAGQTFELSFLRMVDSGLLEQPFVVHTRAGTQAENVNIESGAGFLSLSLE